MFSFSAGDFGRGSSRSLQPFDAVQRVFLHPVGVLVHPGVDVFRVARGVVTLGQRNEPVVAVQLPAQFVVLHGPVAPVDVVAVEIRGLVALVGVEFVLQGFVGLLLLEFVHLDVLQVEAEEFYGLARAEIFQQFLGPRRATLPLATAFFTASMPGRSRSSRS